MAKSEDDPNKNLPKGFNCHCGKYHQFSSYVYAHWKVRLRHVCEDCGTVSDLIRGTVRVTTLRTITKPKPEKP